MRRRLSSGADRLRGISGAVARKTVRVLLAVAGTASGGLFAETLVFDAFQKDGPLNNRLPLVGNAWKATGVPLSAEKSALRLSAVDGEVSTRFAEQSQATVYAGFSFVVTQSPEFSGTFFFSFLGQDWVGRLFLSAAENPSTYRLGIENDQDNPIYWPAPLEVGTRYRAVVAFVENGPQDASVLWLDPEDEASPSVADGLEDVSPMIDGIVFRGDEPYRTYRPAVVEIENVTVATDFSTVAKNDEPAMPAAKSVKAAKVKRLKRLINNARRIKNPVKRKAKIRSLKKQLAKVLASPQPNSP